MRVLVVDDSRAMRMWMVSLLQEMTHQASVAEHGREALELLEGPRPFELALVDWDMPVMDGMEFLRRVRADARYQAMKVIMVTARDSGDEVVEALQSGADDFLMKPVDREMLTEKMRMVGLQP